MRIGGNFWIVLAGCLAYNNLSKNWFTHLCTDLTNIYWAPLCARYMQAGLHTAEGPTHTFRCTVSSQNTQTYNLPFIPPNIPRPCPSVGPLGTSLSAHLPCTFLYWHPYFPSWLGKHAHPHTLTHKHYLHNKDSSLIFKKINTLPIKIAKWNL